MGILDALAGTVGGLLGTFGRTVTLRTYTEVYDVALGTNTQIPANVSVKALVEDYPARDTYGGAREEGGIVHGDKKVTIAARGVTAPTTKTKLVIDGAVYAIVKIDTQTGTDSPLMYVCQARK